MPGRPPRLQGFGEWSDLVRGALMWIGLGDPAATQERLRENDPKLTTLIRIATVWRKAFGSYSTTVAEAVAKAEEKKRVGTWEDNKFEPIDPELLDAFMAVAPPRRGDQPRGAGQLSQLRGRQGRRPGDGRHSPVRKGGKETRSSPLDPRRRSPTAGRKPAGTMFHTD